MASVLDALGAHLKNAAAITAVVSDRVFRTRASTQAALPYLIISRLGAVHHGHLGGSAGLAQPRCQIDCYDDDVLDVDDLAELVRVELHKYRGALGSGSNTLTVQDISVSGPRDSYIPPGSGQPEGTYRSILECRIAHAEA